MKKRAETDVNIPVTYFPLMTSQYHGWMEVSFQQDKSGRRMVGSYSTEYANLKIHYAWQPEHIPVD